MWTKDVYGNEIILSTTPDRKPDLNRKQNEEPLNISSAYFSQNKALLISSRQTQKRSKIPKEKHGFESSSASQSQRTAAQNKRAGNESVLLTRKQYSAYFPAVRSKYDLHLVLKDTRNSSNQKKSQDMYDLLNKEPSTKNNKLTADFQNNVLVKPKSPVPGNINGNCSVNIANDTFEPYREEKRSRARSRCSSKFTKQRQEKSAKSSTINDDISSLDFDSDKITYTIRNANPGDQSLSARTYTCEFHPDPLNSEAVQQVQVNPRKVTQGNNPTVGPSFSLGRRIHEITNAVSLN